LPKKASQEISQIIKAVNARDVTLRKLEKLSQDSPNSSAIKAVQNHLHASKRKPAN